MVAADLGLVAFFACFDCAENPLGSHHTHFVERLVDGSDARSRYKGRQDVVETDDRAIGRYSEPSVV